MSACPLLLLLTVLCLTALQAWSLNETSSEISSDNAWSKQRVAKQVQTLTQGVEELVNQLNRLYVEPSGTGSVYVRWGSKSCPAAAETVYAGVVGGGHHTHSGAGVNALCLTTEPVYDGRSRTTHVTYLYGAEYETSPESVQDLDVVCAVCRTPYETTLMIPGTNTCRPGWTREYHGHLMAGYYTRASGTEFICMDGAMEADHSSHKNDNGYLFYYVLGQCGSLPCPPYQNDKVVTCVVCSK